MKSQVTNKYQQQIELFRSTHYGRDPGRVRRMGYLIKAMFVTEKSLKHVDGARNSLLKVKERSIQLQEHIKAQVSTGQSRGSLSRNIPQTISLDEFKQAATMGDYSKYGENVLIDGNLDLSGMPNIKKLPKSLYVDGNLNLTGCKYLESLPEKKLRVTGSLVADKCRQLNSITRDIQVGEDLSFRQCPLLDSYRLPDMLRTMRYRADSKPRHIYLQGTRIGQFFVDFHQLSEKKGVTFHISDSINQSVAAMISSSDWSSDYPELPDDKIESKDLARWLYFGKQYFCKEDQRKVLAILTDRMRDPVNKQIVMSVLAGIRNHPQEDAHPALELIEKLLRLRGIKQLTLDPDTLKELINKFVGFLDFKQFKSYHKKPFDSQTGSEASEELDRMPEFRKALMLALNLPEDANTQDISNSIEN
ncbi:hypothetical protein [Endozoicomonas acroporae]|uniref:hypothetical protein n=1 Tax=Endozoicomonas acroporae TaxID=1701104 RepID=UPI003D7A66CB